jgi:hypothetical protein
LECAARAAVDDGDVACAIEARVFGSLARGAVISWDNISSPWIANKSPKETSAENLGLQIVVPVV